MTRALVVAALLSAGCFRAAPPTPPAAVSLFDAINARLALASDVAKAKWNTKAAISDPSREAALLKEISAAATQRGLDAGDTGRFFLDQIEASKMVQEAAVRRWQAENRGPFTDAPDLKQDIRPKIDAIGRELLGALAELRGVRLTAVAVHRLAVERLTAPGVTPEVRAVVVRSLLEPGTLSPGR